MAPPDCAKCNKAIKYDDVRCSGCQAAYHTACAAGYHPNSASPPWRCALCVSADKPTHSSAAPLTTDHFAMLMNELSALKTAVGVCNSNADKSFQLLTEHTKQIAECKNEIEQLRDENRQLTNRVAILEGRSAGTSDSSLSYKEIRSRLSRQSNLILKGIPEGGDRNASEVVSEIIQSILPQRGILEIVSTSRVGAVVSGKPRLVKVVLSEPGMKYRILSKKKLLDRKRFPNVAILNDITPEQTRVLRKVKNELHERRSKGETGIFIKYIDEEPCIVSDSGPNAARGKRLRSEEQSPEGQPKKQTVFEGGQLACK